MDKLKREQVKFWLQPEWDNLELLHATYITHAFARHVHETFAIGVIEKGAEAFSYRGGKHIAPAGSIVVINPQEVHTGKMLLTRRVGRIECCILVFGCYNKLLLKLVSNNKNLTFQ